MSERGVVRFAAPALAGLELPSLTAAGSPEGPRLCLLAGVHGGEYSSIAAVRRLMRELDTTELAGTVVAVPIVNMTAFRARAAFVVPEDGKNLNRCFPGDPDGSFADVLAHHVFTELIAGSDYLVDLHGGDIPEALEPFSLYDESPVEATARSMAIAFGLPYVVRQARGGSPIAGTTSAAAAAAGIPGITAEAGGCGLLEADAVETHVRGLRNVLRRLGMLPGRARSAAAAVERRPLRLAAHERGRLVGGGSARGGEGGCGRRDRFDHRPLRRPGRGNRLPRGRRGAVRDDEPCGGGERPAAGSRRGRGAARRLRVRGARPPRQARPRSGAQ